MSFLWVLISSAIIATTVAKLQSIDVRGRAMCGAEDYSNAVVELWEEDTLSDDFLSINKADEEGYFRVEGSEDEWFACDFYLKITHTCELPEDKQHCKVVTKVKLNVKEIENEQEDITTFYQLDASEPRRIVC